MYVHVVLLLLFVGCLHIFVVVVVDSLFLMSQLVESLYQTHIPSTATSSKKKKKK